MLKTKQNIKSRYSEIHRRVSKLEQAGKIFLRLIEARCRSIICSVGDDGTYGAHDGAAGVPITFLGPSTPAKDRRIWSYAETKSLIAYRCDPEAKAKFDTMKRNKYLWEELAERMHRAGHNRRATQRAVRWKNLMSAFKVWTACRFEVCMTPVVLTDIGLEEEVKDVAANMDRVSPPALFRYPI